MTYHLINGIVCVIVLKCCLSSGFLLDTTPTYGLEPDVQELILEAHNTVRRAVTPTASNMQLMSWDESIANLAQRWAENCVWGHDTNDTDIGRFSFGQNIAQSSGNLDWNKAISNWANEKNVYTYNGDNGGKVVGHYTQIVWAESSKVGCGYARCNGRNYYVCNYGPGGNFRNELPYANGTTCAQCPNRCTNGLCDCGGLVCLNGGTLDLKACTCTCKRPFNVQPNCALNCEVAVDPTHCKTRYTGLCEVYSNVPYDCPNMCKWCPNAVTVSTTAVSTTAVSSTTVSTTAVSSTTVSSTTSVTTPSPLSSPVVLTSSAPSATATSTTKQDAKFLK